MMNRALVFMAFFASFALLTLASLFLLFGHAGLTAKAITVTYLLFCFGTLVYLISLFYSKDSNQK